MPFFGSGAVLVPWGVIMLLLGNFQKGLFLLALALALFIFRKLAEPKVVGNQTGLSPLLSLISIYVGMKLGGVIGMILCPILCMVVIGLYGMDFFTPTIIDFRLLFGRIFDAARMPARRPPMLPIRLNPSQSVIHHSCKCPADSGQARIGGLFLLAAGDLRTAQHFVSIIKHDSLSRCHGPLGHLKLCPDTSVFKKMEHCRLILPMVAHPCSHRNRYFRQGPGDPVEIFPKDHMGKQLLISAQCYCILLRHRWTSHTWADPVRVPVPSAGRWYSG